MIERKHVAVNAECSINVVSEQMADGRWAVVSSIKHESPTGEKIIDLPVRDTRYARQSEAEDAAHALRLSAPSLAPWRRLAGGDRRRRWRPWRRTPAREISGGKNGDAH